MAEPANAERELDAASGIESSRSGSPYDTTLKTNRRVLARVTDGIYRQPGSALRELLSNAYDADATKVTITTDRPRFERISIADNGRGMTPRALAHVIHNIGGSAKRSLHGAELGITDAHDPLSSPGGRRLVGKIGIGLFSVAQLTRRFQIITKTSDDPMLTVATVTLRQYSDSLDPVSEEGDDDATFEAGLVSAWREPAQEEAGQGTTIVLLDVRPQTRETLQSRELWLAVDADRGLDRGESRKLEPPRFHIGRVDPDAPDRVKTDDGRHTSIPWEPDAEPSQAFSQLVDAVWKESQSGNPNPRLDQLFDNYLVMAWQLALSIPTRYVDVHPLDVEFDEHAYLYRLPESLSKAPQELGAGTPRELLELGDVAREGEDFQVLFDDLELRRPLRFRGLPTTSHAIKQPLFFVGTCDESFEGISPALSGGPLRFVAYLMWSPKIVPTEHQGSLVRIHGATGTGFDPTFMRYQVAEVTRLRQITCEIFVTAGLEGALNIDRESFNYAHPHVVYLTKWLHNALRRVSSTQKRIASQLRSEARDEESSVVEERLTDVANDAWHDTSDDEGAAPPKVEFSLRKGEEASTNGYRFDRERVFGRTTQPSAKAKLNEKKLATIVQVLAAYHLLDSLSEADQLDLVARIRAILEVEDAQ